MAREIEKKWLVSAALVNYSDFKRKSDKITEIEQGYIPHQGVQLKPVCLAFPGFLNIPIDNDIYKEILAEICDMKGGFPKDLTTRYRIKSTNGKSSNVFTIKGNKSKDGLSRDEIEFSISEDVIKGIRKLNLDAVVKTRMNIPCGKHTLEVDFYKQPVFAFISVETEFQTQEEIKSFDLPGWLAVLKPIDVTPLQTFKNIALLSNPSKANSEFARLMKENQK
ncbi:MAG: hypothetical protein FWE17_02320 [Alphaproteobacteria bacterium]|nr:hypothetical protein [Alphaproteobacteria bacterium]MCL2758501.1 hypothetical protein [Alphaproteobacteria bacterium]